jgi:hypothetical protein
MAYDTQIDRHLASNALKPALMFASEYYFRHAGRCSQAEGRPGRANSASGVEAGVCWLYEASGKNGCGPSDGRKGKLSRGVSS